MDVVAFHHNAQASQLPTAARDTSISDSLTVSQQAAVALAFKVRDGVEVDSAGKDAGKGYLGSEETAFTLAATQDQWLAAPVPVRDVAQALTSNYGKQPDNSDTALGPNVVMQAVGTDCYNGAITGDVAATIGTPGSSVNASGPTVMTSMQVRRLTVTECERLQGFPDGYTNIPGAKDGPRYKALGNSMAVPCMKWIGERICN